MIGGRRPLQGRKVGDRRVRIERPHSSCPVLYNQTARRLRAAIAGREHTVIADVPYRHRDEPAVAGKDGPDAGPGNDSGVASSA